MSIFYIWFWGLLRAFIGTCVVGPPSTHPSQQARQRSKSNPRCLPMGVVGWTGSVEGLHRSVEACRAMREGVSSGVPSPAPTWGADHKQTTNGHMGRLQLIARLYLLGKILGRGARSVPKRSPYDSNTVPRRFQNDIYTTLPNTISN